LKNLSNEVADVHRKLINDKIPETHDDWKLLWISSCKRTRAKTTL